MKENNGGNGSYCGESIDLEEESNGEDSDDEEDDYEDGEKPKDKVDYANRGTYVGDQDKAMADGIGYSYHAGMSSHEWEEIQ